MDTATACVFSIFFFSLRIHKRLFAVHTEVVRSPCIVAHVNAAHKARRNFHGRAGPVCDERVSPAERALSPAPLPGIRSREKKKKTKQATRGEKIGGAGGQGSPEVPCGTEGDDAPSCNPEKYITQRRAGKRGNGGHSCYT